MPYGIMVKHGGEKPVGHFHTITEASQALEGHVAGSYICAVDGHGNPVVPAEPSKKKVSK